VWWEEGDTLFYETNAGTVGIPRDQVVEIRRTAGKTPSYRAREEVEEAPREAAAPPARSREGAPPSLEELDRMIERSETGLRRAGSDGAASSLARRLADLHVLRGRERRKTGDLEGAVDDYESALARAPAHRIAIYELGWTELGRGRPARALDLAETGLAAHPGDAWLLSLRGELFHRDSRLRDALEDLSRAAALRPDDSALRSRLEKVRRDLAAEHDYDRALSQHFVLRFDGERDETLGKALFDALEAAWNELTDELSTYPLEPVTVILYSREQFADATGSGREVAGLFDGKIRLPIGGLSSVTPRVERVLRHELTHALLHVKGSGRVPRWLHEGLAQRLEPRSPDTVRASLAREAEGELDLEPFTYAKSLSFVSFLDARQSRARVLWLVELLAAHTSEADAFERAFGASREALVEEWRRWLPSGS